MCIWVYVCMHLDMCVGGCMRIWVCVCVYLCVCLQLYIYRDGYLCTCTQTLHSMSCNTSAKAALVNLLFKRFNLKVKVTKQGEREKKRGRFSMCRFTPQMDTVAGAGPVQSQELQASSGSPPHGCRELGQEWSSWT